MIDPNNFLSYPVWLDLPKATRYQIAAIFNIPARGVGHTVDSRVVADNFVHADLAVITKERMREITGLDSQDFYILFQALVDKVEGKTLPQTNVQQEEQAKIESGTESPRGRKGAGRKAKGSDPQG